MARWQIRSVVQMCLASKDVVVGFAELVPDANGSDRRSVSRGGGTTSIYEYIFKSPRFLIMF